jgi:hypothetical protein
MGGGLAYFKTIRLCSIVARLSNTIAVVAGILHAPPLPQFRGVGSSKRAPQMPKHAGGRKICSWFDRLMAQSPNG